MKNTESWSCDIKAFDIIGTKEEIISSIDMEGIEFQFADGQNDNILLMNHSENFLKIILEQFIGNQ